MKILALIPARGGSKGIPQKNIVSFIGRPLIDWTLQPAHACSDIDKVYVSTDCHKIAEVCEQLGYPVPFMRPHELSTDSAKTLPVATHAVDFYFANEGFYPDGLILLQPTSPLRRAEDIKNALSLFKSDPAKPVVSVSKLETPAAHLLLKRGDCYLPVVDEDPRTPRQQLSSCYFLNGAIFITPVSMIREKGVFYEGDCHYYEMDSDYSVDIDEPVDLVVAEEIYNRKSKNEHI